MLSKRIGRVDRFAHKENFTEPRHGSRSKKGMCQNRQRLLNEKMGTVDITTVTTSGNNKLKI